jgi:tetratricopeptide (TPR) repeat protein
MTTLTQAFELAVTYHRGGNLQQAEALYRQVLAQAPRHAMAMHLLGVLAAQSQRVPEAVGLIQQAIAIDPNQSAFHANLGDLLRAMGRMAEARTAFDRALSLDASSVVAHYNLGLLNQAENRRDEAIQSFQSALRLMPELAQAHNELGNLYREQGQHEQALTHFQQAVASRPDFADGYNDLGNLLQDLGRLDEAIAAFQQALQLRPTMWPAHYNLGNALRAAGRAQEALASYRSAIHFNPQSAVAHNNLGTLLQELRDFDEAERAFAAAVQLAPDLAEAHFNLATRLLERGELAPAVDLLHRSIELDPHHAQSYHGLGTAYQRLHQWGQAAHYYREAIRVDPACADPHCSLGIMAMNEGRHSDALQHFETVLELNPSSPEGHCNRGLLRLGEGDYERGWPAYLHYSTCRAYRGIKASCPVWDGSPLGGRTLRIVCDHGLGDTLQFVRYVPWLREQGAGRILLAAQTSLHPLLEEAGFGELVAPEDESTPCDAHISIMMLPAFHYAAQRRLWWEGPYLRANASLVDRWRARLDALEGRKVGICWSGSPVFMWNEWRSVPLEAFEPLTTLAGIRLVVLQHGDGRRQLDDKRERFKLVDFGGEVDGQGGAFRDSAAIIESLDLVITSDTSLAHVAAALGRPVWMALSAAPEWRWQRHGDTTPWYPSMRLFRQRALKDWSEVFGKMADELPNYLVQQHRGSMAAAQ